MWHCVDLIRVRRSGTNRTLRKKSARSSGAAAGNQAVGVSMPCESYSWKVKVGHSDKELSIGLVSDAFGEAGSILVAPIKMTETEASCLGKDMEQMRKW